MAEMQTGQSPLREQRFVAADMSAALKMLGETLGSDAILLSSKTVAEGVEIVALPPGAEPIAEASNEPGVSSGSKDMQRAASRLAESIGALGAAVGEDNSVLRDESAGHVTASTVELESLQRELSRVREMLEDKLNDTYSQAPVLPNPVQYTLLNRILQMGLPMSVARVVTEIGAANPTMPTDELWHQCLARLRSLLAVDDSDPVARGGVYAIVGPPAVGKTAAIAKLAARYMMGQSAEDIAIIVAGPQGRDSQSALQRFSRITGIAMLEVDKENTLSDRVRQCARYKLVLIDGIDTEEPYSSGSRALETLHSRVATLLVLPAYAESNWLAKQLKNFDAANCRGCIVSHWDSSDNVGGAVMALMCAKLPAMYLSSGSVLPSDIEPARADTFLNRLSAHSDDSATEVLVPTVNMYVGDASESASG